MSGIYIYSDNAELAAQLCGFAQKAGKEAIIIAGKDQAESFKGIGADRIAKADVDAALIPFCGKGIAEYLQASEADLFLVSSTARGRELGASVAGYLDCPMVSDAQQIEAADDGAQTVKIVYGGRVNVTEAIHGFGVVSVAPMALDPAQPKDAETVEFHLDAPAGIDIEGTQPIVREGVDLSKADKVICAGLGIDKEEDLGMIRQLADIIGAEVGCTRSVAESRKWMPESAYIGMTGVVIRPTLYIGIGVSGQMQHIFGVKDAKVIVGIDKNEKAPIFGLCDYGIVGDLYEAVPALIEALK